MNHGDFRRFGFSLTLAGCLSLGTLCVLPAGCSKSSPVEPESLYMLDVHGTILNESGVSSLVTFQGFLDGVPFDLTSTSVKSQPRASDDLFFWASRGTRGAHTIEIRILAQQGSPQPYRVANLLVRLFSPDIQTFQIKATANLPDASRTLATGEGFLFSFSL